ncbi:hypothetical protein [Pseudomonas sp. R4-39-08]|uniref:hypothetical protein n=1 Tax=Pseudomonas sp. R4-39-08 TaxID=1173288 RepID=UPI000F5727D6|nr:hypothetical protein [Pseudomonas sp. R4-39-08]
MKIKLMPFLTSDTVSGSVNGDVLTLNGDSYDFAPLKVGFRLPSSAIASDWFVDYVERRGQAIHLTLRLPVQADSPDKYRNPIEPIVIDARNGPITFPDTSAPTLPMVELPEAQEGK